MTVQLGSFIVYSIVVVLLSIVAFFLQSRHMVTLAGAVNAAIDNLAHSAPVMPSSLPLAAGGGAPVRQDILPWLPATALPVYGQLTQTLPESGPTTNWYNDCGETCCSMVVRAARGVYCAADELRVLLRGQGGNPLTNADDLVSILHICHIHAHTATWGSDAAISAMRQATQDGRPCLALGTWPTPGGVLHWLLVYAVDGEKVYYINPWGAVKSWLMLADWATYTANSYVIVDSHLLYS